MAVEFGLSRDQQLLRDTVREFAQSVLKPKAAHFDRTREFPLENWARCAEMNLTGMMVPEEWGGAGVDFVSYVLAIEEVSRACASTGVILSVNNSLVCGPLMAFGTDDQKKRYLVPHARGEKIGAYCLTEPSSGSDSAALRTTAKKQGDRYRLDGNKVFVTNGVAAHTFLVYATIDPALKHRGITAFLVERDFKGVRTGKPEHKLGITCSGSVEIVLEGVEVPAANRLGGEGEGFKIAMATLDAGRIGIAAQSLGIGQASLDEALAYSRTREAFGKPIADLQAIQWKLADMATEIDAARLLTWRAAWTRDTKGRGSVEASMAKLFASEACMRAAKEALQIHGGYGYINEYPVERLFRDAKITEIYEGTSEIQRLVIAKTLLKDGAS
ncbi:MAG TPA: acyl-CoA dehydrogenase [Candidatus Polarisedimenticolia bacterium]|nr:acyl-CoA dehydrogenase [Candidatus Polarisedimenticolia bacterium]